MALLEEACVRARAADTRLAIARAQITTYTGYSIDARKWLEPWELVRPSADAQLVREVGSSHPLHALCREAVLIGARGDCDDRLYWLPDPARPLAVVHLTWSRQQRRETRFPETTFFASREDWVQRCLRLDHEAWITDTRPGESS